MTNERIHNRDKYAERVSELFRESADTQLRTIQSGASVVLVKMAEMVSQSIERGGKLMLCGNGGSAADSQHLAAELLVRLRPNVNRNAFPAITLATDTSTLTACGNDYSFDDIFARPLSALGKEGDVFLGISTSGKSKNILKAMTLAREKGISTMGFLGCGGGDVASLCDKALIIPSDDTGRIQEGHITAGHALIELIEDMLLAMDQGQ